MKIFSVLTFQILFSLNTFCQIAHTDGKQVMVDGEPVLLKGINLGNWLVPEGYMFKLKKTNSPGLISKGFSEMVGPYQIKDLWRKHLTNYITQDDITFLKKQGFNHIRLPFHYKLLNDEDYLGENKHGYRYIDSTVKWCKEVGLSVILDMHCAPCGQTGDNIDDSEGFPFLMESKECQDEFVRIWSELSSRYKDEKQIIGYGLINEPIAHYFVTEDSSLNDHLMPLYKRTVEAIRETGDQHIIMLSAPQWNTNFGVFDQPFDDNIIYEFHKYWMPPVQEEVQWYVDYSNKYNVPIYLGESGENTMDWIGKFRKLLEANDIGWCFWTYKKMNSDRCVVQFKEPSQYKNIIVNYLEGDRSSYELIRKSRPNTQISLSILNEIMERCHFKYCTPNEEYLEALFDQATNAKAELKD